MELGNYKEKKVLARLKRRDKEAFLEVYDLYADKIYRFIYYKIGQAAEAEDLSSSVFLKTWNYVQDGNLKDVKTLRALVYRIARNVVIDHYRQASVRLNQSLEEANAEQIMDHAPSPAQAVDTGLDSEALRKALSQLKDEYREVVILRFVEELSVSEIAEILGKSSGNVRVLVHRGLKALKEVMEATPMGGEREK